MRSAEELRDVAMLAAAAANITRVADVTRLDRIGLPCWQAVRPMGKSLSVHQGKGLTDEDARLGAILEGLEAHFGEIFDAPRMTCSYRQLPAALRPPALGDFAKSDAIPIDPDLPIDWVEARDWSGANILIPFACISLDFTQNLGTPLDRSSNGIAVGSSREEAITSALLELIERDAVTEWKARPMIDRMEDQFDFGRADLAWLDFWLDRLRGVNASLRCYAVPSFTGVPVVASELGDAGKSATPFHAIHGHSAHPDPEVALFRAMAEAVQGRAAYIAGSRDDLLPSEYAQSVGGVKVAFAMPLPDSMEGVDFHIMARGPERLEELVAAIEAANLGPVVVIDLGRVGVFHVVRVIACGLAARDRRRRKTA